MILFDVGISRHYTKAQPYFFLRFLFHLEKQLQKFALLECLLLLGSSVQSLQPFLSTSFQSQELRNLIWQQNLLPNWANSCLPRAFTPCAGNPIVSPAACHVRTLSAGAVKGEEVADVLTPPPFLLTCEKVSFLGNCVRLRLSLVTLDGVQVDWSVNPDRWQRA